MIISLRNELVGRNKFSLYGYKNNEWVLLEKGEYEDGKIETDQQYSKLKLNIYHKHFSKALWVFLYFYISIISSISASFGKSKLFRNLHKTFIIDCDGNDIELVFNHDRFDIVCTNQEVVIKEYTKGKLNAMMISTSCLFLIIMAIVMIIVICNNI